MDQDAATETESFLDAQVEIGNKRKSAAAFTNGRSSIIADGEELGRVTTSINDGINGSNEVDDPVYNPLVRPIDDAESNDADPDQMDPLFDIGAQIARRDSIVSRRGVFEQTDPNAEICGWGPFHPNALQRFRSAKWALFCFSLAGICQGMIVNGLVFNSISTIERRFDLKSSETGLIASGYDFASLVCLIPVSYFGGVGRKPSWVGIGVLLMACGSLLFMLPHFTTGVYQPSIDDALDTCSVSNSTILAADCEVSLLNKYKFMFIFGQLLHGMGASPLFTLGVSYLDDNLLPSQTSLYVGIFYSLSIIGPAVGFILGGVFLNIYTDAASVDVEALQLSPSSPKWVGGWWIGFVFASIFTLIVSILTCAFPKTLPGHKEILKLKVSEAHGDAGVGSGFTGSIKEFPSMLKRLLTNPTFVFISLAGTMESLILSGFATFSPKFVQNQFGVTASSASFIIGAIAVPAGGGGTFFGGWIVKHKKLRVQGILKLCVAFAVASFFMCFGYLVQCENSKFAGVNHHYVNQTSMDLIDECNMECRCSRELYNPVCDGEGVLYFSPCHAGCQGRPQQLDEGKYYGNCSCIMADPLDESGHQVKEGRCDSECKLLPLFLVFFFGVTIFTFLASMPALSVTLRCVAEDQKSFALGIQWLIVRALGTIPAAPIIGGIIDFSCTLWQEDCGAKGSCYAYDNSKMSLYLMAAALTVKFLSVLFLTLAYFVYKPPVSAQDDTSHPEVDFITTQDDVSNPHSPPKETTEL